MKSLIVYDSWFGNTRKIAHSIAAGLGDDTRIIKANGDILPYLKDCDLLVVGSPTHGGTVTPATHTFLDELGADDVARMSVAAFDTRVKGKWLKVIGFASQRIARLLQRKGGVLIGIPEGFYVDGKEGPLAEGEEARAQEWAASLVEQIKQLGKPPTAKAM